MDGTLLDSIASANRVWSRWADRHGIDREIVLRNMHGVRAIDTIRSLNLPELDAEKEADAVTEAEIADLADVVAIDGAKAFLHALPTDRWAIVTSAPRALAIARIEAAGLPIPRTLVTAEDVARGKPAADCYLLAASALEVAGRDCLVWEDTVAGVTAGEAAGAAVIVVGATHKQPIQTRYPTILDYHGIAVGRDRLGGLVLNTL